MPQIIEFANDKSKLEVSALQPVLKDLLESFLPLAFDSSRDYGIQVDRFVYDDARIKTTRANIISFHGITDLSCIAQPFGVPVCGFENKVSKHTLIEKTGNVRKANAAGKKAMSQAASQILGALTSLHTLGVSVPVFTAIATNGWQFLLVRRAVKTGTRKEFVAFVPVSLGEERIVDGKPEVLEMILSMMWLI